MQANRLGEAKVAFVVHDQRAGGLTVDRSEEIDPARSRLVSIYLRFAFVGQVVKVAVFVPIGVPANRHPTVMNGVDRNWFC